MYMYERMIRFMKKVMIYMKKLLCYILTVAISVGIFNAFTPNIYASQTSEKAIYAKNDTYYDVDIHVYGEYDSIFPTKENTAATKNVDIVTNSTARFSYVFELDEDRCDKAFVIADITLQIDGIDTNAHVEGEVRATKLSTDTFWEGPLLGKINVNDNLFDVTVGFSKMERSNDARLTMTIVNDNGFTSLAFGEQVFTESEASEIIAIRNEKSASLQHNLNALSSSATEDVYSSDFTLRSNQFTNYQYSTMQYYSLRARAYYSDSTNRFAITTKSYASYLTDYYNTIIPPDPYHYYYSAVTSINNFSISLRRNDYSASCIVGIENPKISGSSYGSDMLSAMFEDIMSILGVPIATIRAMFGNIIASFSVSQDAMYSNERSIRFTFGTFDYVDFDNSDVGVPIVFQIIPVTGSPTTSQYEYSSDMTYKVDYTLLTSYLDPQTQQYIQYRVPYTDYVYTGSASRTVSVNVG